MKEKENYKIIIPTLYIGGIEPEEPKEYDVWYYDIAENHKMLVYSGKKWCECFFIIKQDIQQYNKKQILNLKRKKKVKNKKKYKNIDNLSKILKVY